MKMTFKNLRLRKAQTLDKVREIPYIHQNH